jgi:hypothetical protein
MQQRQEHGNDEENGGQLRNITRGPYQGSVGRGGGSRMHGYGGGDEQRVGNLGDFGWRRDYQRHVNEGGYGRG